MAQIRPHRDRAGLWTPTLVVAVLAYIVLRVLVVNAKTGVTTWIKPTVPELAEDTNPVDASHAG